MVVLFTIWKASNGLGVRARFSYKNRCCTWVSLQNSVLKYLFPKHHVSYVNMLKFSHGVNKNRNRSFTNNSVSILIISLWSIMEHVQAEKKHQREVTQLRYSWGIITNIVICVSARLKKEIFETILCLCQSSRECRAAASSVKWLYRQLGSDIITSNMATLVVVELVEVIIYGNYQFLGLNNLERMYLR